MNEQNTTSLDAVKEFLQGDAGKSHAQLFKEAALAIVQARPDLKGEIDALGLRYSWEASEGRDHLKRELLALLELSPRSNKPCRAPERPSGFSPDPVGDGLIKPAGKPSIFRSLLA